MLLYSGMFGCYQHTHIDQKLKQSSASTIEETKTEFCPTNNRGGVQRYVDLNQELCFSLYQVAKSPIHALLYLLFAV